MKRDKTLRYEGLELPENLNHILEQDFWMLHDIGGAALGMLRMPMKFTSFTSIFVRKGVCKFEINLQQYDIEGPCVVNIGPSDIMQPLHISEDFEGAFVVMSDRFLNNFRKEVDDPKTLGRFRQSPVLNVPVSHLSQFEMFYNHLRQLTSEPDYKYLYRCLIYTTLAFFFETAVKCLSQKHEAGTTASHITNRFMKLARENFKKERFMDFYAKEMGITGKHLGRTIKAQTGFTASEWLDRLVILEAKVLLKSSGMTIQQISEELNFPSQSFFGKYFKNLVGISPKEFRNA